MLCFDAPHDITDKLGCWCCAYFVCVFRGGRLLLYRAMQADPHLPRRQRRRSSIIREEKVAALRDLPMLKDTSLSKREVRAAQCVSSACRHTRNQHTAPLTLSRSLSVPRQILFKQKLALCSVNFNFDNPNSNKR